MNTNQTQAITFLGAIVNFVSHYIIGIPFGYFLISKASMGITGMWIGMFLGTFSQVCNNAGTGQGTD